MGERPCHLASGLVRPERLELVRELTYPVIRDEGRQSQLHWQRTGWPSASRQSVASRLGQVGRRTSAYQS